MSRRTAELPRVIPIMAPCVRRFGGSCDGVENDDGSEGEGD